MLLLLNLRIKLSNSLHFLWILIEKLRLRMSRRVLFGFGRFRWLWNRLKCRHHAIVVLIRIHGKISSFLLATHCIHEVISGPLATDNFGYVVYFLTQLICFFFQFLVLVGAALALGFLSLQIGADGFH